MSAEKYWLWLSGQNAVSARAKAALIARYLDAESAFMAPEGEYKSIHGVSPAEAERLERRELDIADRIRRDCLGQGIDIITMQDARYPARLRNIQDPPPVLYVKGRLPDVDEQAAIAVIGTRQASPYGLRMGRKIACEISRCGGIVISGLGEGVDRAAARGCLDADGICIGVLGTGHGNESRFHEAILEKGALVSEYPPGMEYMKLHFRERNRISAGLSCGVAVVEAPEKSGALLFAAVALEQGREIFAVPGNVDSPNSAGSNSLIKQGAKPVTCGWDVLSEFEYLFPGKLHDAGLAALPQEKIEEKADIPEKQDTIKAKTQAPPRPVLREQLEELSEDQLKIVSAIDNNGSHLDDIIEASGMAVAKVLANLTVLELKGFVRRESGRRYSLNTTSK